MHVILTAEETRVLGALVEKSVTTPEHYPLTLNALIAACNQKSNRDPVVQFDGRTVGAALDGLRDKGLTRVIMGGDSRVPKYQHYFEEAFEATALETALLDELMLRGPQTPGELRGRMERFGMEASITDLENALDELAVREVPLTSKLPRQPGRREARYAHLLAGEVVLLDDTEAARPTHGGGPTTAERLTQLEATVAELQEAVTNLRLEVAALRDPQDEQLSAE